MAPKAQRVAPDAFFTVFHIIAMDEKNESNIFRQSIHCFDGFFWLLLGTHMKNTRENPSQRIAEKCSWAPVAEQMDLLIWMGIKPIDGLMIPSGKYTKSY
jgi:hypothetical protein